MGGTAGIGLFLGMVRVKFAAVLIGTGGFGLLANFMVIQNLVGTIAGLGLQASAVRDIAAAATRDDQQIIGRTVLTLRRMCWLTGILGMVTMMVLSPYLSQWTFGSSDYTVYIALLGLTILLGNLSIAQVVLIRGMRRIGDFARVNLISATVGTVVSIGFYVWLGLRGIVPVLLTMALTLLIVSWYFARRIPVQKVTMTWRESFREAGGMVRLGIAMMWSGLLVSAVTYATNAMVTHQIGLDAVGIYTAAFVLSGMFVNFVLGAMGGDYYPRLAGVSHDKEAMNKLVNEQTEIGLLLAVPGLLATLSLSPWIIQLFYSSEFMPAVDLLQWFILGCLGRIIQWPMGYIQLALGKGNWFVFTQTLLNSVHLLFIWLGLMFFHLEGVSIAFFLLHVISLGIILLVSRFLTGFRWSNTNRRLILIILPVVGVAFLAARMLPLLPATIFGTIVTIVASILCLRGLLNRVGADHHLVHVVCRIPGIRAVCGL